MSTTMVYDLPTRIFHWMFVVLFVTSLFIAKVIDDESALYSYHMLSGIMMSFLIFLRIIWGLIGTKFAKFSSFHLTSVEFKEYFKSIVSSKPKRYLGHNPASSYAALAMFTFTFALVSTGLLMSNGIYKHFFEEVHEMCAQAFVLTVILHIAGVIFHNAKHRDGLAFSMVNGNKDSIEGKSGIKSERPFVALFFVALVISFGLYLNKSYNSDTQKLTILGIEVRLGE